MPIALTVLSKQIGFRYGTTIEVVVGVAMEAIRDHVIYRFFRESHHFCARYVHVR
jgi:hypothetical protein